MSGKLKHTTQHWQVWQYGDVTKVTCTAEYGVICVMTDRNKDGQPQGYSKETIQANAKLIASAPELLNALSFLLNDLDRNDGDLINRATLINEAKQAINKATK